MKREPLCIRETLAIAANAHNLNPQGRAVEVLGALGAAAHNRYFDDAKQHTQARLTAAGTAEINPAKRLASLLQRAKAGVDHAAIRPAIILFAHELNHQRDCQQWRIRNGAAMVLRFAERVVLEWLRDRCAQCGGAGRVPVGKIGQRNTLTQCCGLCGGSGAARISHPARAQAIGVTHQIYDRHWTERFIRAHALLLKIESSNISAIHAQLRVGTMSPK